MKRLVDSLGRALLLCGFACASAIAACALILYGLEKSGWLADWVRAEVRGQLAASGTEFDLEGLELDWFLPAVTLKSLSLGADGQMARIESATLVLAPFESAAKRVKHVRVDGGRVRLSAELFEMVGSLDRTSATPSTGAAPILERLGRFPRVEIDAVQFDVAHPRWGDFPLGAVSAVFDHDSGAHAQLQGVLAPSLTKSGDAAAAVFLSGRVDRPGILSVRLSTAGFPLSTSALPPGTELEAVRDWQPAGILALEARAELALHPEASSSLELRARLAQGSLTRAVTRLELRDLSLDLEANCKCEPGRGWFDPEAWSALASGRGLWKESPLQAFARYGRAAGPERILSGELCIDACEVSLDALAELGLSSLAAESFQAIAPRGKADLALALALDRRERWSGAVDARLHTDFSATYNGWPPREGFTREGFPLPVEQLRGRVCATFDPAQARAFQLGLLALQGNPVDDDPAVALCRVDGVIVSAAAGTTVDDQPEFLLDFQGQGLSVGEATRKAIEGLSGTAWIWPEFSPDSGSADGRGRLMSDAATGGIAGHFEIRPKDLKLTWKGLPIPMDHGQGKLDLTLDPRAVFGITFDMAGTTPTAESVRVRGRVQQDPALAPGPRNRANPERALVGERDLLMDFDVAVSGMALRGSDREVVAGTWAGVGAALDLFQPSGKADVNLRAARARPGDEIALRVEIEPRQVQLTPQSFSTPTKNVLGRVLVQGSLGRQDKRSPFTTRIAPLVGEWPQDARVACHAVFPESGANHIEVRGAGIDVTNRSLIGAFRDAFAGGAGGGGFDLRALTIDGRIDFDADVAISNPTDGAPRNDGVYRVFLRDNSFRTETSGGFGLSGLWGELVQRDGVLTGERIQAQLGSTAVTLHEARFIEENGTVRFTTGVKAPGLPLDREHLGLFLDPDTVSAAIDRLHLSGWIDFEDAKLEYTGKSEKGNPKLMLSGDVRPRDAYVDLGLPLSIDRARVNLRELVLEGGHVRAWAKVNQLFGSIANRKLEGARMLVTYVEPRLSILDLSGRLEDGRIGDLAQVGGPDERPRTTASGPAFTMDLLDPYRFELGLALRDVELGGLLRGMFQSEFADTGFLDAQIRLEGSLEKLTGIVGDGWVHLRKTRLWSIPVMRDLLSQLGLDSSAIFESMNSRIALADGVIRMDAIHVESPILQLVGSGQLDLDGRLEHDLQVRFALVDRLGPVTRLWYWIQNNLLSISVRGDMSRPQIVLKGALSFLQTSSRGKRQLPLPSLAPLPARF